MAEIRILDKHTAELIAAGEVVERPASVVKELTENAIDAGAKSIEVEIAGGGIRCIEIRDDGCGIEPEYMPNAFVRHATSKISCEDDLAAIHTLGFRGEALASVASVARVTLVSKTARDECAWCYTISGGEEISLCEDARGQGTTITVRDLFYNTPARMKFLKKDATEAGYVQEVVSHLALSHPEISFRFIKDGKEQFFTPGDGKLASAAHALYPRDYARELVPVHWSENNMTVTGLVTPPRAARASRSMQCFYVNGRFVKSRSMVAAVENAFRGMLMGGRFPGCVLMLTLPADAVDVNVHPAKTEVRFARESDVFNALYRAVKAAILQPQSLENQLHLPQKQPQKTAGQGVQIGFTALQPETPAQPVQFTDQSVPAAPATPKKPITSADGLYARYTEPRQVTVSDSAAEKPVEKLAEKQPGKPAATPAGLAGQSAKPFARDPFAGLDITVDDAPSQPLAPTRPAAAPASGQEQRPASAAAPSAQPVSAPTPAVPAAGDDLTVLGEVFKTYIVAQRGDELCFIDKHAAHERILYEALASSYGSVAGQLLLMPVSVELSAPEKAALLEQQEHLENIGLSIEDFGGNTVMVREVPADIRVENVEDLVLEIAARLAAGQKEPLAEKTAWVLHSIACRGAIKGGDTTHMPELLRLARDILDGIVPPFCPHGRPVILRLTQKELEKQFGRLG